MNTLYSSPVAESLLRDFNSANADVNAFPEIVKVQLPYDVTVDAWQASDVDTNISITVDDPQAHRAVAFSLASTTGLSIRLINPRSLETGEKLRVRVWNPTATKKFLKLGTTVMLVSQVNRMEAELR